MYYLKQKSSGTTIYVILKGVTQSTGRQSNFIVELARVWEACFVLVHTWLVRERSCVLPTVGLVGYVSYGLQSVCGWVVVLWCKKSTGQHRRRLAAKIIDLDWSGEACSSYNVVVLHFYLHSWLEVHQNCGRGEEGKLTALLEGYYRDILLWRPTNSKW